MFRANRVGTPVIHTLDAQVTNTSNTAPNVYGLTTNIATGNTINAASVLDYGRSTLNWVPGVAQTVANNTNWAFGQTVTVTQPINGDTVGLELIGAMRAPLLQNCTLIPFISTVNTFAGTVLGTWTGLNTLTQIGPPGEPPNPSVLGMRSHFYKESVIFGPIAQAYTIIHGFIIQNVSGGVVNVSHLQTELQVRQLNDQQNIGYRDTRR